MKKVSTLLVLAVLAGCNGDSTGSSTSLAGQWVFRLRAEMVGGQPVGCHIYGTVHLTGSGSSFSGKIPVPDANCSSSFVTPPVFDSTTTLTAQVQGDSALLTLHGRDADIQMVAQIAGDSLAGRTTGGTTGVMGARRFPDSVPIDRSTVQLTGAVTRTAEIYGRGAWSGLIFVSAAQDEAIFIVPTAGVQTLLAPGTYTVGGSAAPLHGYYDRWVGGTSVSYVLFTSGTVTITSADTQLVTGSLDVTGELNGGSEQVRVQTSFTMHHSAYPSGG